MLPTTTLKKGTRISILTQTSVGRLVKTSTGKPEHLNEVSHTMTTEGASTHKLVCDNCPHEGSSPWKNI